MKKQNKLLYIPLCYHLALFITMLILQLTKSNALGFIVLLEMCGIVVSPVYYAVWSICHAIVNEGKVFDYFNKNMISLAIIGGIRIVFYLVFAPKSILFALGALAVSLGVYSMWSALFALTDKMMKKRPGRRNKKRK